MSIKLVIGGSTVNVISAYAPQVGLDEEEKKAFCKVLIKVVSRIPSTEWLVVEGDFNGHIGFFSRGYNDVHGSFDFGEQNEVVKRKVVSNKVSSAKLVESKDDKERQTYKVEYKVSRRKAKLAIKAAKTIAYESLYVVLEEKRGDKNLYRLAKASERRAHDLDKVKYIKREDATVLVEDSFIQEKWHSYFHKLLNDERDKGFMLGELEKLEDYRDCGYYRHIKVEEVKGAICRMRWGRTIRPDKIPMNFLKSTSKAGFEWLSRLFNIIFRMEKMHKA
ncbi:uncharacterized protein LOC124887100 [Capsicum annuum]|uniref:uncharacterized protein LOC124887100 n=1 Tax=Capsicum annuum TaxID=4072 RepID=UPI001FB0F116|nr:uncharacterized protein LOC124887100 [Capsicum annuum]